MDGFRHSRYKNNKEMHAMLTKFCSENQKGVKSII